MPNIAADRGGRDVNPCPIRISYRRVGKNIATVIAAVCGGRLATALSNGCPLRRALGRQLGKLPSGKSAIELVELISGFAIRDAFVLN